MFASRGVLVCKSLHVAVIEEVIAYCETHQDLIKLEAQEEAYRLQEKGVNLEF